MPANDILTRFVVPMTDSIRDFETQANKPTAPIRVATPSKRKCHSSKPNHAGDGGWCTMQCPPAHILRFGCGLLSRHATHDPSRAASMAPLARVLSTSDGMKEHNRLQTNHLARALRFVEAQDAVANVGSLTCPCDEQGRGDSSAPSETGDIPAEVDWN
jgi:hypothetical protein